MCMRKKKVKVAQSCPSLCYPMNCSPPGSSIHEILQAGILEWVAITFSRGSFQPRDQTLIYIWRQFLYGLSHQGSPLHVYGSGGGLVAKSRPTLATPWTIACQAPLSIGFSRQEYWSGLPFPSPFMSLLLLSHSVVSDSVWPHRRQPTRLPRAWDSPGKNTGVGCHFLLQCMKVKSESHVIVLTILKGRFLFVFECSKIL